MRSASRLVVIVVLTAWVCPRAFAPIYGGYPGLHSLIKQSDIIAAVTILEQLSDEDMGGSARYKVRVAKLLKGSSSEKQLILYIRFLWEPSPDDFLMGPTSSPGLKQRTTYIWAPVERLHPFHPESRWVVFLTKPREGIDAAYENVNRAGSAFPLSPLREIETLRVDSLPHTLVLLFSEYVEFKRSELKEWEKQLDTFIHQPDY
jgi:hypothetical protein